MFNECCIVLYTLSTEDNDVRDNYDYYTSIAKAILVNASMAKKSSPNRGTLVGRVFSKTRKLVGMVFSSECAFL